MQVLTFLRLATLQPPKNYRNQQYLPSLRFYTYTMVYFKFSLNFLLFFSLDAHTSSEDVLYSASKLARKKYGIKNSTIQIERQTDVHNANNILEPITNFV